VLGGPVLDAPVTLAEARKQKLTPAKSGEFFGPPSGGWKQRWFKVRLPKSTSGMKRYFFWECQGETTAYFAGVPWAGLDVAHSYCRAPQNAGEFWLDCGTYQTCIWVPREEIGRHGLRFDDAYLTTRNEQAWAASIDLTVLEQLMTWLLQESGWKAGESWDFKPDLVECSPLLRKLLYDLDSVCDAWDVAGLNSAAKLLARTLRKYQSEDWQLHINAFGHSHLDLVWMWPEREGERKGVHTCASMVRLLEDYPEFRMFQSQPANLAATQRRAPELFKKIEAFARQGRWEFGGAMDIEAENTIAHGEALSRNLIYGQRQFQKLRGALSPVLWLPDCFGFTAALPQLMRLAGVKYFFTCKMSWCTTTLFPFHSFVWRGPDGSEVVAHQNTGATSSLAGLIESGRRYRQAAVNNEFLMGIGVGDGGGGTTEREIELARRFKDLAQTPQVKWGSVEGFFTRLEKVASQLPIYEGEMYLEYHRGTYTTQGEFKRVYRQSEVALQSLEALRVARGAAPLGHEAWKRTLFAQFHDALPGTSIELVYRELGSELQAQVARHLTQAKKELDDGKSPGLLIFNPLALERTSVVELPANGSQSLSTPDGRSVAVQKSKGKLLASVTLPPIGSVRLLAPKGERPIVAKWTVKPDVLDNGIARAEFDALGRLTRFWADGKELRLVRGTRPGGEFVLHLDIPADFDAWDIDQQTLRLEEPVTHPFKLKVIERGPVRASLCGTIPLGKASRLTVAYILEAGSPYLRIETTVDWYEQQQLLKFRVNTAYQGPQVRYGTPFGSVTRSQKPGYPREEAMWEVPGSRWAAVMDEDGADGLAVITEAKYGFSCRDGNLGLSLLRAAYNQVGEMGDHGIHHIRFALGRHHAHITNTHVSTAAAADTLFTPVVVAAGGTDIASLFRLENLGSLTPAWVLPAESSSGYILRLHETVGGTGVALLHLAFPAKNVEGVDLLERKLFDVPAVDAQTYRIEYRPYQIISIRIQPKVVGRPGVRRV